MAHVEILEVERAPIPPGVRGASIDLPATGHRQEHYALVLAGWVAAADGTTLDVEASCRGRVVARLRADRVREDVQTALGDRIVTAACGFVGVARTLDLPLAFELRLDAVGSVRAPLGVVRGRRSVLPPSAGGFEPIFVTALGRTGSTLLMHLLAQHPDVVVRPPFPYETRAATYWTEIFDALASPTSYLRILANSDDHPFWWTGARPLEAETYVDQDAAARWLGGGAIEALADFARRQVTGFYGVASAAQVEARVGGRSRFAEKRGPEPRLRHLQAELFPGVRELFLVRDWRDALVSVLAFNRKRGHQGFWRERVDSDAAYVRLLGEHVTKLLTSWRDAGEGALLVRYEDLVRAPATELERVFRWAGLDATAGVIARVAQAAAETEREAQLYHRTSATGVLSVGRWRQELPVDLREPCEEVFAEALAAFGYERHA